MPKVVQFPGVTRLDKDPNQILQDAVDRDLDSVLVMGYDKDGDIYMKTSHADGGEVMWLMELCKARLVKIAEELSGSQA